MGAIPSGGMWKVHTMTMKISRLTAAGLATLFLVSFLTALAPPATAQQPTMVVEVRIADDPNLANGRLLPETGVAVLKVTADITFSPGSGCIVPVKVTFTVKGQPSYSSAIMNPAQTTVTFGQSSAPVTGTTEKKPATSELIVTVTRDAPAFKDDTYKVLAKAEAGVATQGSGCNLQAGEAEGARTLKNDFLPLTQVNPTTLFIKSGQNKKIAFPVELINLGNGPTLVKLASEQPFKNKLDAVNPGAEIHLESRASKGAAALFRVTRSIEAVTPHNNGYTNQIYQFNVKFASEFDGAAVGQLQTRETQVSFSVQVQGVYVPGFDPLGVVAALGIAVLGFGAFRRKA